MATHELTSPQLPRQEPNVTGLRAAVLQVRCFFKLTLGIFSIIYNEHEMNEKNKLFKVHHLYLKSPESCVCISIYHISCFITTCVTIYGPHITYMSLVMSANEP